MVEGLGLNPQLQSFWMAIHPPIVFSAYAFVVLAFALILSSLRTNQELEKNILFKISTYASWILLTIGIALGGVWAYTVLGRGGYRAWGPVETALLLPQLILTAYFLTRTLSKHKTPVQLLGLPFQRQKETILLISFQLSIKCLLPFGLWSAAMNASVQVVVFFFRLK